MLINTFLDTEDFVHLYYPEDEPPQSSQGCGAGARMHGKYAPRPPSPNYDQIASSSSEMSERSARAPPPPEPPPRRARAADLYPRVRTHYDEPGLDVPFTPICAEFVQWVGRTADNGTLAMSNYRLHVQPRRSSGFGISVPLRMIDSVEVRELVHLVILCKDGKTIKCTFPSNESCMEWWRRVSAGTAPLTALGDTFAAAFCAWAREEPPASATRALAKAEHRPHWFHTELKRLGFTKKGAWRVTHSNVEYKLCSSYPPLLIVPASIEDSDLEAVARFRAMRRIPAVVWRHRGNGAVIARASQPEVGWLGWRSGEDERLLAAYVTAAAPPPPPPPVATPAHTSARLNHKQNKLLIIDARSYASAVTNRARGGGVECQQYYPAADIQFMCLPNIHHVRRSFHALRHIAAEDGDHSNWQSNLERSLWLQMVSGVGRGAAACVRAVLSGRPVLVHCSDGWDRTPQITAAAQLMLDPYYRTIEGFRVLIEREWLDFGHKFASRCGHQFGPEEPNERSPIFLQWLDFVHQMMLQYPTAFEFNNAYLIKLLTHVHSCMFGTFLCNSAVERAALRVREATAALWPLLQAPEYQNHLYTPPQGDQVLFVECGVRWLVPWWAAIMPDHKMHDALDLDEIPSETEVKKPGTTMSKTRSCEDLTVESERRPPPRRCSDPNISADIMKMSSILPSSSSSSLGRVRNGGSPPPPKDQVDGLHLNHFENGSSCDTPRDLASNSSSLERELQPAHDDLCDMLQAAQRSARARHVSITWRSVSESSQHTDQDTEPVHNNVTNHNGCVGDAEVHASSSEAAAAAAAADTTDTTDTTHSNSEHHITNELASGDASSSSSDGESICAATEEECGVVGVAGGGGAGGGGGGGTGAGVPASRRRRRGARRGGSAQTLCPASPRRRRNRHAEEALGVSTCAGCVCGGGGGGGGGGGVPAAVGAADGLRPLQDPTQARLHQIISHQRGVVEELSRQLRAARDQLAAARPPAPAPAPAPASAPALPQLPSASSGSASASASASSSCSEVETGWEAPPWLPDEAVRRCQRCHQNFWLARRRHHCRRCGGVFCGSCCLIPTTGEWADVRVCLACRDLR